MRPSRMAVVAAALLVCALACADDWPQWRGARRDGCSSESISVDWPSNGPPVVWRAQIGTGFASVSIAKGRAYTLGNTNNQDTVWCFQARTGKPLWQHIYSAALGPQYYEGGPGATPTVAGNRVFTIGKWGDVFCFNAANGKVVWHRDLRQDGLKPNRWGFAGSPLLWRNLVILNAGAAGTALDRDSGRLVWCNGTNAAGYASPVLWNHEGKEVVLVFAARDLVALDPETGREYWRYPWKTDWDTNNSDPLAKGDQIFISSFSRGCALLTVTGERPSMVYDSKVFCNNLSPGILSGEFLYGFSGEAKKETEFRCLRFSTGDLKWSTKTPAFGSVIRTRDHLLVLSEGGELSAFGSGSGAAIFDSTPVARALVLSGTCWTPPALANGLVYLRNAKGDLVCLDLGPLKARKR